MVADLICLKPKGWASKRQLSQTTRSAAQTRSLGCCFQQITSKERRPERPLYYQGSLHAIQDLKGNSSPFWVLIRLWSYKFKIAIWRMVFKYGWQIFTDVVVLREFWIDWIKCIKMSTCLVFVPLNGLLVVSTQTNNALLLLVSGPQKEKQVYPFVSIAKLHKYIFSICPKWLL